MCHREEAVESKGEAEPFAELDSLETEQALLLVDDPA